MRIRRSTLGHVRVLMILGLARMVSAQTPDSVDAPSASSTAQPPPVVVKSVPGPAPLGVDGQLTTWLQIRGEFRARIEGFTGGGFAADSSDAYWMDRFRFNATVNPAKSMKFVVQVHDARAFHKTTGSQAAPFRDTWDLRMAYGEFGSSSTVRIGRQELAFGEQRLLGHLGWANTARSFDGARVSLKRKGIQLDAFAVSVVTIQPDAFDRSGSGNGLFGGYLSTTVVPKQTLESYFLWRQSRGLAAERGGIADLRQATTGVRMAGKLPSAFDYSTETAVQTGSVGPDAVRAWASHWLIGKTLAGVSAHPRFFGEYNYASGDGNRADGTRGTFDQLYPTGHDKYGLADQVGWRNIHHARTGVEFRPSAKWGVNGGYHSWWLASVTDALYSAGGAAIARSAAGTGGRHVGQEVDVQAAYNYSPQLQIGAGYAHLIPGEFLTNTSPGHSYSYPYLMVTYVFLGEKPAIAWRNTQ
jgi:Alginate export